jgi:cobalt transport protein
MKYWPYLVLAVTLPTLLILYIISLGYTPLTIAVLTLPNETEILLFTVFAGVGAGTIGHFFGYRRAEKKNNANASKPEPKQGKKPIPFIINPNGDFGGTDGQGPEVIEDEGYTPWIGPVAYQPDDLGERLLFSLQVGLGGAVLGYFVGFETGKAVNKEEE